MLLKSGLRTGLTMALVVLLLATVFGSIFGWKWYQQQQLQQARAAAPVPTVTVSSATVQAEPWQRTVRAVGSLRAFQGVDVSSEVPGSVANISFNSGQPATQGQVLVQLDAAAERAELRSLAARLELARLDYERALGLKQRTAVSQAQLDRARSEMDSLTAQSEEQQALIAKKAVRAPFAGELGIRLVDVGEYLSPGTAIVTLQQLDPIYVDFTLPERYLSALQLEQEVTVSVSAYPDQQFRGHITAISPKVEASTRNVVLQASLNNQERQLRPGMFASIDVLLGEEATVLTLPQHAISYYPYGDSVFLISEQEQTLTVTRRQVEVGPVRNGRVQIESGVTQGEQVVATGQLKLRTGQQVRIDNSVKLPTGATSG